MDTKSTTITSTNSQNLLTLLFPQTIRIKKGKLHLI